MTPGAAVPGPLPGPVPPGPDFVVLTGFLGSGKTTLLRDFLARPEAADTAVIVNEAGEIGLDGAILAAGAAGVPMAMLANGCVCCQAGGALADTVAALLAAERPGAEGPLRRIVLETSGLSKPGPVLRQLAALAEHRLRVAVVATYDAVRGLGVEAFEEAAAQWGAAHRIVVTKADAVSAGRLAAARAEAAGLNPLAAVVAADPWATDRGAADRGEAVAAAFAPLPGALPMPDLRTSEPTPGGAAHPRVRVCLARPTGRPAWDDLATWLDNMAGALGERLLRSKGLVRVAEVDRPILVQSVGTLFAPLRPFAAAGGPPFLVVIARDTAPAELEAVAPRGLFRCSAWPRLGPPGHAAPGGAMRADAV